MSESRSFVFQSHAVGGRQRSDRSENETLVTVDFVTRAVRVVLTRAPGDEPGAPVGLFEAVVEENALSELRAALETDALEGLGPATGGGPGATVFELSVQRGDEKLTRLFTSRDFEHISAVREHLDAVSALSGLAENSPVAAVEVEARRDGDGFAWTLVNVGREPIRIPHPLRPEPGRPVRTGVRVSFFPEPQPGITAPPLDWELLTLAPLKEDEDVPEWLELGPGARWSRPTLAWRPDERGRHLAQGVWEGFGRAPDDKPVVVQGMAFSDDLELTP